MTEDGHSPIARIAGATGIGDEERMHRAFVHQARARQDNVYLN